jgi:chaperonin GroES
MARPPAKAKARLKAKIARGKAGSSRPRRKAPVKRNPSRPPGPAASGAAKPASRPEEGRSSKRLGVRPVRDRVMVKRIELANEKVGRIIVPDSAKEKPLEAEVVAVGSGRVLKNGSRVPLGLRTGDHVLIGKWAGTEVRIGGEDYLILREDEVLGIFH